MNCPTAAVSLLVALACTFAPHGNGAEGVGATLESASKRLYELVAENRRTLHSAKNKSLEDGFKEAQDTWEQYRAAHAHFVASLVSTEDYQKQYLSIYLRLTKERIAFLSELQDVSKGF